MKRHIMISYHTGVPYSKSAAGATLTTLSWCLVFILWVGVGGSEGLTATARPGEPNTSREVDDPEDN
jgi:hypothetical protein